MSGAHYDVGSWVWIEDEKERFLPAQVKASFAPGEAATVMTDDGEKVTLTAAQSAKTTVCNPEAMDANIEDLINISDLNESAILHMLRIRFRQDKIYTNISSILVSVNPFKQLPLYTPAMLDMYRNGTRGLAPHVFASAYHSYHNMLSDNCHQSVVISGESGAGKSEATKLILQFLTDVSSRSGTSSSSAASADKKSTLEQQILAANPILEAFGNAKTLRNNNSSRFGKLITINFDKNGSITGGGIINYLLERSRVVTQTVGERNYHIFYQLLSQAAISPQLTQDLKLQDPSMFDFTNPNHQGVATIEGVKDDVEFDDLQRSMQILHFSKQEQTDVFKIVAGVLHFGNVKFGVVKNATGDDGSGILNKDTLATACELWGVQPTTMEKYLTNLELTTGGDKILKPYSVQAAKESRDAMCKKVYCDLFQWTVDKINRELSSSGVARHLFIGVLDIFGFESFRVNSFEQLCINFCNEKLQFHFNEHIFKMEQTLYAAEGINIPGSTFVDNQPTLDLLEKAKEGIFGMTDEEINVPKGTDVTLLSKILKREHPNLIKPKPKECPDDHTLNFGVLHYAGPVYYNITNFLDKNKDALHECIVNVIKASTCTMITDMFGENADATHKHASVGGAAKAAMPGKKPTLGGQFKTQLNDLVATLNTTHPHFVRCMKSNDEKKGNIFAAGRMQDQLRYAGLVEVCRIRKLGFPVRRPFDEFFKRFRCCFLTAGSLDNLLQFLTEKAVLKQGEWAKGHSKIFMRTAQSVQLEVFREQAFQGVAVVAQKTVRRFICRRRLKRFKRILADLKDAMTKREDKALTVACEAAAELPYFGSHLAIVKQAKTLLARVREENKVTKLLQNAIDSHDINALKGAVQAAASLNPPFQTPLVQQAQEIIARLEAEMACKAGLNKAINERNLAALTEFIGQAAKLGLRGPEIEQATSLKARIEEEDHAISDLKTAVDKKSLADINAAMSKCVEMGLSGRPECAAANKVKDDILAQMAADKSAQEEQARQRAADEAANTKRQGAMSDLSKRLEDAIASRNQASLNACLQESIQVGLQSPQVAEAQKLLSVLNVADEARSQLKAAQDVLRTKSESGLVDSDLLPLSTALKSAEEAAKTCGEFSELVEARAALETYKNHVQLWIDLKDAVEQRNRPKLKESLDAAENLRMTLEIMAEARIVLRELELKYREEKAAAGESLDDDVPYDAAEEARKIRQETARQAKYEIRNFAGLRSEDDFAKGSILNKSKIREAFLNHQATPIPKSISQFRELAKENSKKAIEVHRNLLGYMGDKQMPFPAMLAQDVLRKGFENKALRDEIYVQLIKQLTNNPRPESVAKGWQLMCMCVGTFPPSLDFEMYLMHYILDKRDKGRGAVVDYAKYCLRTLEAMLSHGENVGFVPDVPEITAYKERPPILASVSLVDGAVLVTDLPITPDTNVGKILEMCANWLALRDPRLDCLGLFVYDLGETDDAGDSQQQLPYYTLERTPRPLRNDDYMGDVVVQKARQRRKFKFVLKNKIFLPANFTRGDDPGYERMIYLQSEDEVIIQGHLEMVDEADVVRQASISLAVCFGEDMGADEAGLIENKVIDFISPAWRDRKKEPDWARAVLAHRSSLMPPADVDVDGWYGDLQAEFVSLAQKNEYYGTHWFYVYKMEPQAGTAVPARVANFPRELVLGFNHVGLHIFTMQKQLLGKFPYGEIYRWGGSSSQFSLIMADESASDSFEFVIITAQAADMAAIILDHIRALMAVVEASAAP